MNLKPIPKHELDSWNWNRNWKWKKNRFPNHSFLLQKHAEKITIQIPDFEHSLQLQVRRQGRADVQLGGAAVPVQDGAGAEEGAPTGEGGIREDEGKKAAEEQDMDGVQQGGARFNRRTNQPEFQLENGFFGLKEPHTGKMPKKEYRGPSHHLSLI